jgi:hypothetical protein
MPIVNRRKKGKNMNQIQNLLFGPAATPVAPSQSPADRIRAIMQNFPAAQILAVENIRALETFKANNQ